MVIYGWLQTGLLRMESYRKSILSFFSLIVYTHVFYIYSVPHETEFSLNFRVFYSFSIAHLSSTFILIAQTVWETFSIKYFNQLNRLKFDFKIFNIISI